MNFAPQTELDILTHQGSAWNVASGAHLGVPNDLALIRRFALDVSSSPAGTTVPPAATSGPVYGSDTDELRWDMRVAGKGVVTVNTLRTKSVVGFIHNRGFLLGNVGVQVGSTLQDWATVSLTLREGDFAEPDADAAMRRVAPGLAHHTTLQWKDASRATLGTRWAAAPSLSEVIPAVIDLPFPTARTRAWAVDETGQRKAEPPVVDT